MTASIGTRWTPHPHVRHDTRTGEFEACNTLNLSRDELRLQRALLRRPPKPSFIRSVAESILRWELP